MFSQIFLLPQVKRSKVISNKHGIKELPCDLRNEDLRKLGKVKKIPKILLILAKTAEK